MKKYKQHIPFFLTLLLVILPLKVLIAQDEEKAIVKMLADNDLAKAQKVVENVVRRSPGSAKALYLQALVEKNADNAIKLYNDILLLHKNSPFASKAQYKVSQYYFVKGYYFSARKNFLDVVRRYPDFEKAHDAGYYAAKCLLLTGKPDSAEIELTALLQTNVSREIRDLIVEDLRGMQQDENEMAATMPEVATAVRENAQEAKKYTVQIGAYSRVENANSQKKYLAPYGYIVDVVRAKVNRRYLYKVYVGRFASEAEAVRFADAFQKRHRISCHIVKLEE